MQWLQSILRSEPSKVLQLAAATAVLRYETYGEAGRRNLDVYMMARILESGITLVQE